MILSLESFAITLIVFMWLVATWEFLNMLSWGRARRTDNTDKDLSDLMEVWLDQRPAYDIVFKILIFTDIAIMSVSAVRLCEHLSVDFLGLGFSANAVGIVLLSLVLGEAISKAALSQFDIAVLKFTIPTIKLLRYSLLFPVVLTIQTIQSWFDHLQHDEVDERTTAEDEIMSLVEKDDEDDAGDNALEEDERMMIKGIFELDDTPVREIMMPRVDVHGLPVDATTEDAKREFVKTGHSRIPVYEGSIDEIKGIIYAKDFLDDEKVSKCTLEELMHKPFFIPESKAVDDLLDEVKRNNTHIAVVIDEYGGTAGIVTLEDIIEEIVGEIHDEFDTEKEDEGDPEWQDDGSVTLPARTLIGDVNELLDTDISEDEDSDTIGGLICELLGKIPEIGDVATVYEDVTATVINADKRRVITVSLKKVYDENEK